MNVHGFANVVWDDAAFPDWFWEGLDPITNPQDGGCWVWSRRFKRSFHAIEYVVTRLTKRQWKDFLAVVPTCANVNCLNPAHLCITERQP